MQEKGVSEEMSTQVGGRWRRKFVDEETSQFFGREVLTFNSMTITHLKATLDL